MQNPIALLEECLANGDQGQAILYAWFLCERNVIVSAIQQAAKQVEESAEETPYWKLDPHIAMHRIVTKRQAASAARRQAEEKVAV